MSFEALQQEVTSWPESQVRQLQAFLVTLRHQRDAASMQKLASKLDDTDPSRWISLEEVEKRLGLANS